MFCRSCLNLLLFLSIAANAQEQFAKNDSTEEPVAVDTPVIAADIDNIETSHTEPEQALEPKNTFSGEGSLGWISNKGNTNNESLNADLKAALGRGRWLHSLTIATKKVRDENIVTTERYLVAEQSNFAISKMTYLFGSMRYDDDRFDGFEYQASAVIGVGWHLINYDTQHLDLELGAGYREAELTATAENKDEAIAHLGQHYDVNLGEATQLFQDLLVETGDSNTTSEFTTGLKISMNSKLALKLSYNIKYNSDPALGNESTDRTTSVNLVYGF